MPPTDLEETRAPEPGLADVRRARSARRLRAVLVVTALVVVVVAGGLAVVATRSGEGTGGTGSSAGDRGPSSERSASTASTTAPTTAPTTTALASGPTAATNFRDFKFEVKNNLVRRPNVGLGGLTAKPQPGRREVTGSFTAEYENMTSYLADYRANTSRPLLVTYTSAEALSTGNATLQFAFPAIKLRSGVPVANGDEVITVEHKFKAYATATLPALYTVLRTSDTAL